MGLKNNLEKQPTEAMSHGIKNALLIYNPTSGRRRQRRFAEIEHAARILKDAGIIAELAPTTAPGQASGSAGGGKNPSTCSALKT